MVGVACEADYIKINFYNRSLGDGLRPGEVSVREFPLDDKPLMGDPYFDLRARERPGDCPLFRWCRSPPYRPGRPPAASLH